MSAVAEVEARTDNVVITLRTHHARYLEDIAEQEDCSVSFVLGALIENHDGVLAWGEVTPPRKVRQHVQIAPRHLRIIDRLSRVWGLSKSDVVRRLIDDARRRTVGPRNIAS